MPTLKFVIKYAESERHKTRTQFEPNFQLNTIAGLRYETMVGKTPGKKSYSNRRNLPHSSTRLFIKVYSEWMHILLRCFHCFSKLIQAVSITPKISRMQGIPGGNHVIEVLWHCQYYNWTMGTGRKKVLLNKSTINFNEGWPHVSIKMFHLIGTNSGYESL